MNITLVFPPSICLPNQVYYSLPLLAGVVRRAGHVPSCVDLNLAAADRLLDARMVEDLELVTRRFAAAAAARGDQATAAAIAANLDRVLPLLREGAGMKRDLRDPVRFWDQPRFKQCFWGIVDILGYCYQLDERISPFRASFARDVLDNQRRDPWTAMLELWERGLVDEIFRTKPDVIGLSIAFPEQAAESIRTLRRIRERDPSLPIVVGGPLVSGYPEQWLGDGWLLDFCDYVVLGDGETALVELLDALAGKRELESVRHLVRRDARGEVRRPAGPPQLEDLDGLPLPDFAACEMSRYFLPEPIYPLMLSRGCYWGKCTFCSIGWRENYRAASFEKIRADARHVARTYGGRFVQLQDSSAPPKSAKHLAQAIEEEGLGLTWVTGMRFEKIFTDLEACRQLARGGCRSLLMGFESSDQRLLDLMEKGYRLEDLPVMLRNLREAGISAELLWFIGFPTQTRQDVLDTARFLYERRDQFGLTAFVGEYKPAPGHRGVRSAAGLRRAPDRAVRQPRDLRGRERDLDAGGPPDPADADREQQPDADVQRVAPAPRRGRRGRHREDQPPSHGAEGARRVLRARVSGRVAGRPAPRRRTCV
jgi:tRNA A37 methylthiotransferase MiaB